MTLICNRNHFFSLPFTHFASCILRRYLMCDVAEQTIRYCMHKTIQIHQLSCIRMYFPTYTHNTHTRAHIHTDIFCLIFTCSLHATASFVFNRYHPIILFNMIHFQISFRVFLLTIFPLPCFPFHYFVSFFYLFYYYYYDDFGIFCCVTPHVTWTMLNG